MFAVAATGCSGDSDQLGPCEDDEPPQVASAPAAALVLSQFKLESRTRLLADGTRETLSNLGSAVFVDTSRVKRVSRSVEHHKFSLSCSGLSGALTDQCRETDEQCDPACPKDRICLGGECVPCVQVYLEVDEVAVSGVDGLDLQHQGVGTYVDTSGPDPLFDGEFTVKVTGRDAPGYFPSYEQSLAPPDPLHVDEPKPGQKMGARDLEVCWNKGNGDLIEIMVQIESASPDPNPDKQDTDKVVCLARDDGCHTIPVGAFDWLMLGDVGPEDGFKLTVVRQKKAIQVVNDRTAAEIKGAHRVEMSLPYDTF